MNNSALNEGGAIFLKNSDIDITYTKFSNNTATIGGAIRYLELTPSFIAKYYSDY